ncbi:transcriptional regulator [Escherichia coli]|uniref:transcriptional regulator n=1 Tax=Escherichia coli TaxID=562 RepID=UPI001352A597|nr:transcriptional regulator [Escherichia coli]
MLFKQTMVQFLSLKRVNGMDSIKLLDKAIIYQQQNEQSYPAQEFLLLQLCIRVTKNLLIILMPS